ncbi:dihydrolipoyllysine-residue acetyltransferase component 5 of pyruvate dehydrogenase complex, chloroplastic [Selaginella moellendorffii]|nr:dihydrolipoyllysine-residue acetyltransferase component 5 of pyruvate dehydrogenase complex, chloroplastic [Selaginella moellendorffii]|eukprot:XP_024544934.1 dihydrolipoyllysine-residue acetyltransferase component 5 of pyruvate dehydrogenase complex, chloroplastic [Selaginella moellendorffii]
MAAIAGAASVAAPSFEEISRKSRFLGDGVPSAAAAAPSARPSRRSRRSLRVQAKIREIFMPALSSTMTEGKIVSWMKAEGDKLSKGESVVVVESDKADMDVETFYDGYLASIVVGEGEVAPVGAAIGILAESLDEVAEAKAKFAASSGSAPPPAPPPAAIDSIAPAAPVSSPPPPPPPPSAAPAPAVAAATPVVSSHPASQGGTRIVATPYAKKLAKELKVDLAAVAGTGPSGRITGADVEASTGKAPVTAAAVTAAPVTAAPSPVSSAPAAAPAPVPLGSTVPFTGMQAAVCKNMVESLSVPTFRVGYTITTDALDALYKKIKSKGVTMSALLAKAVALAVAQHPVMNASCKDGKSFTYNASINIAVAVAIDGGLITPVLQDADKLDIYSLSRKWKELVDKARAKQLQPSEYNSGTFTLSNLGMFGVDRFDAILPPGTGAIMAVGASAPTVVATSDGLFGIKNQMQVNITADHRIIYGADVAAFLQTLAKIIENPKDLTL